MAKKRGKEDLSLYDIAEQLSVHVYYVRGLVENGLLTAYKNKNGWLRVTETEFKRYLAWIDSGKFENFAFSYKNRNYSKTHYKIHRFNKQQLTKNRKLRASAAAESLREMFNEESKKAV